MAMLKMILLVCCLISVSLVTTKPQLGPCLSPTLCRGGGRIRGPALGGERRESLWERRRVNNRRTGAGFRGYGR